MLFRYCVNKHGNLLSIYVPTGRNEDHEKKISWSCYGRLSGDRHHETVGTSACCVSRHSGFSAAVCVIDIDGPVSGKNGKIVFSFGNMTFSTLYRHAFIANQNNNTWQPP